MELCLAAFQILEAMLPDQKPVAAKTYRPSNYNQIYHGDHHIYVYNILTRRLARLTEAEAELLLRPEVAGTALFAAPLIAKRFFVPADTDEVAHYVQLYSTQELFLSAADRGLDLYRILPTTGCNARCFYCFEQGVKIENMTQDTADAVITYILKTRDPQKKVTLSWFGGEPLLRPAIIDRICIGLQAAGVSFTSTMITNGSLFTPKMIQKARELWGLDSVQITLDGMGEEHDRRKSYVSLPNAYNTTLENISALIDAGIGMMVRMNMDMDNAENLEMLYDNLRSRYTPEQRFGVNPELLAEKLFSWSANRTAEQQANLRKRWLSLRQRIREDGFYRYKPLSQNLSRWHCIANSPTGITILPDGTLSMCQTGCEEMYYGNVRDGITKPELVKKWRCCTDIREKCKDCAYLPECTGFALCPSQQSDCRTAMADNFRLRLERTIRDYENK